MNKPALALPALLLAALLSHPQARADETEELLILRETTASLLDLLVEQGLITRERADTLLRKARERAAGARVGANDRCSGPGGGSQPGCAVRIPYLKESDKREIEERVRQEVLVQAKAERWGDPGASPEWTQRIKFEGDFRLRFQQDRFPGDSGPNVDARSAQLAGIDIENTTERRERLRVRFRFGMTAAVTDAVTVGLRLASGNIGPGSEIAGNQDLGTYGSRFTAGIDRAYLQVRPNDWLSFSAGRIANPFYAPTNLVWYEQLSLDGVTARATRQWREDVTAFANVGFFPVEDVARSTINRAESKYMLGYQVGGSTRIAADRTVKFAVGLFDYHNTEGISNPTISSEAFDRTAPQYRQKGNSVFDIDTLKNQGAANPQYLWGLAARFRQLNISGSLDIATFDPVHVVVDADYVKNLAFDQGEIRARTGLDLTKKTTGYQARLTVGHPRLNTHGAWHTFMGYRHLERDAVLDAFTDTEFALGGTNVRGYFFGAGYGIDRSTHIGGRWMSTRQIDGPTLGIDILQLDVMTSF